MSSISRGSASLMVTAVVVWRLSTLTQPSWTLDASSAARTSAVMSNTAMPGIVSFSICLYSYTWDASASDARTTTGPRRLCDALSAARLKAVLRPLQGRGAPTAWLHPQRRAPGGAFRARAASAAGMPALLPAAAKLGRCAAVSMAARMVVQETDRGDRCRRCPLASAASARIDRCRRGGRLVGAAWRGGAIARLRSGLSQARDFALETPADFGKSDFGKFSPKSDGPAGGLAES
mmetsp:Transcript_19827/g.58906  ORF Transcript_19827/g.58906 Transcript_19827/m.58906 type:complete len:235 (+) Transcript_19827:462-1166(+)